MSPRQVAAILESLRNRGVASERAQRAFERLNLPVLRRNH